LIIEANMRLWAIFAVLLSWPFAVLHTLQARRRLRAYALPAAEPRRLTLERVA
jgi:hypothetical protein